MRTPLLLAMLLLAPFPARAEKTRVLVTGFDPFGGSPTNNSWSIANELPNVVGEDVEIVLCRLPVVYDEGARTALSCLEQMEPKPDLVISMGEAGCSLRLETAAHNLDDTPGFPDNAGNIRERKEIIPGAPKSLGFDLPVQEAYCSLPPELRARLDVSESPGGYVCNNTSYHLAHALQGTGSRFAFVHVPNSRCSEEDVNPRKNAEVLAGMIARIVEYHATDVVSTHPMPHCSNDARLPTDTASVDAISASLDEAAAKDCEREFLKRLRERL